MVEKGNIVTTLSVAGANAEGMFRAHHADPANFVFPVREGEEAVDTPFGKIGVAYASRDVSGESVRIVLLDISDAPVLRRRGAAKPLREIHVNEQGTGAQTVKNVELFVATNHFQ